MTSILGAYFSFLKTPTYNPEKIKLGIHYKFFNSLRIAILSVTLSIIVLIVGVIISNFFQAPETKTSAGETIDTGNRGEILFLWIFAVTIAPILEEFAFRTILRFSPIRLSFGIFFFILLSIFIFLPAPNGKSSQEAFYLILFFCDLALFIILSIMFKFGISKSYLEQQYKNVYRFLYYFSSLLFGLAHAGNFTNLKDVLILIPILVMPQTLFGFAAGFIRSRYGLLYSMLTHSIYNFMIITPILILSFGDNILGNSETNAENLSGKDTLLIFVVLLWMLGLFLVCTANAFYMLYEVYASGKGDYRYVVTA